MSTKERHTFVVLAYKESPFLEACISSLLNQSVASRVLICTSTPSQFLEKISEQYSLPLHVNQTGERGIGQDWNYALSLATSPYVTLAHQDDIYDRLYTETFLGIADRNPDLLIGFTDYQEIVNEITYRFTTLLIVKRLLLSVFWIFNVVNNSFIKRFPLLFGNPICCPSVWFNKSKIGDFVFDKTFKVNLDWDAWHRLAKMEGSFAFVPKPLVYHRVHTDAESAKTIQNFVRRQEDERVLTAVWGALLSKVINRVYSLYQFTYHRILEKKG